MLRAPHVAVLIETSRGYGRGLLEGVARYNRQHGPWSIYFEPHGLNDAPPAWLARWRGDGILARINDRRMANAVLATGLPAVDLRGRLPGLLLPFIGIDNEAVARMAFEHLRGRGLTEFAFCGLPRGDQPHMDRRQDAFRALAEAGGFTCRTFAARARRAEGWEREQERIADWLHALPKPVGVMTCHDDRGHRTLDACRRAGVSVPNEVAVISVDNDEILCAMAAPPMTSIDVNAEHIGYEATALLGRLMTQGPKWDRTAFVEVPPGGVVTRQSTDVLAIADTAVSAAVRFIRDNACHGLSIAEVARHVGIPRGALDLRFKAALGHTPKSEVVRVRLERARLLLTETNLPLDEVAQRCGIASPKYLGDMFHRELGVRPGAYRRRFQRLAE